MDQYWVNIRAIWVIFSAFIALIPSLMRSIVEIAHMTNMLDEMVLKGICKGDALPSKFSKPAAHLIDRLHAKKIVQPKIKICSQVILSQPLIQSCHVTQSIKAVNLLLNTMSQYIEILAIFKV